MKKLIVLSIAMTIFAAGCTHEVREEVKTVEYYKENREELRVTVKKCNDNPQLDIGQNCINAHAAYKQTTMNVDFYVPRTEPEIY